MMRLKHGRVFYDLGEYSIEWSEGRASWTLYDRNNKQHHHGLATLGVAHSKIADLDRTVPTIGLVACCKTKLEGRTVAERLYASDLFQKAAAYCRKNYTRWFILSAKYGLVCPSQLIEPYEETLVGKTADEQKEWAGRVVRQMKARDLLGTKNVFYVHAGQDYARFLLEHLPRHDCPLKGLGIGQQKAWYKKALSPPTALALAGAAAGH